MQSQVTGENPRHPAGAAQTNPSDNFYMVTTRLDIGLTSIACTTNQLDAGPISIPCLQRARSILFLDACASIIALSSTSGSFSLEIHKVNFPPFLRKIFDLVTFITALYLFNAILRVTCKVKIKCSIV